MRGKRQIARRDVTPWPKESPELFAGKDRRTASLNQGHFATRGHESKMTNVRHCSQLRERADPACWMADAAETGAAVECYFHHKL